MIQNQKGAGLAPLGNFCDIEHQVLLLKMPKDPRLAPDGFSNLRVSATPTHKKVHTHSCFALTPLATRLGTHIFWQIVGHSSPDLGCF